MIYSKILIQPVFKDIPQTDAANVEENIVHWLNTKNKHKLSTFCRPDKSSKNGYRFIGIQDLDETIITHQTISKIDFEITWFRRLHTTNTSFYPLYFSEWFTEVTLKSGDFFFNFKSDNDLKKHIREIKK